MAERIAGDTGASERQAEPARVTAEEQARALSISIGDLTARLNGALFALHTIAREDYRGPRPHAVQIAEDALRRHGECECHENGRN